MAHFTNQPQDLGSAEVPTHDEAGCFVGNTSTPSFDVKTIDIIDSEGQIVRICCPSLV